MNYKAVKGMHDILPAEIAAWQKLESLAREHFALYGYAEIRTPILESTSLFQRGVGETTDIVQKEMFTFEDQGGDWLTLRPEGTAAVVRSVIENNLVNIQAPQLKVYYTGAMFRRERPQKGRLRQFHQMGVECFGSQAPETDAEIIEMISIFLQKAGVGPVKLLINSLGKKSERQAYQSKLKEFFSPKSSSLCVECQKRLEKNPLRVLDCKNPDCQKVAVGHPIILDSLEDESRSHFEKVKLCLTQAKIEFTVQPTMVRGLDYYERTVFEFVSDRLGAQSTLAAGGRYDGLLKDLGGPDLPGVGFALGVERLLLAIGESEKIQPPRLIYVAWVGDSCAETAMQIARDIRAANLICEIDYEGRSLKSQMRRADKLGALEVIILGEEEMKKQEVLVRHLLLQNQTNISLSNLNTYLTSSSR